jgi:hypothetical protein
MIRLEAQPTVILRYIEHFLPAQDSINLSLVSKKTAQAINTYPPFLHKRALAKADRVLPHFSITFQILNGNLTLLVRDSLQLQSLLQYHSDILSHAYEVGALNLQRETLLSLLHFLNMQSQTLSKLFLSRACLHFSDYSRTLTPLLERATVTFHQPRPNTPPSLIQDAFAIPCMLPAVQQFLICITSNPSPMAVRSHFLSLPEKAQEKILHNLRWTVLGEEPYTAPLEFFNINPQCDAVIAAVESYIEELEKIETF